MDNMLGPKLAGTESINKFGVFVCIPTANEAIALDIATQVRRQIIILLQRPIKELHITMMEDIDVRTVVEGRGHNGE